jgi:hypothetical protein
VLGDDSERGKDVCGKQWGNWDEEEDKDSGAELIRVGEGRLEELDDDG